MTPDTLTVREAADRLGRSRGHLLEDRPPRESDRFLYVIEHVPTGLLKIGISVNPWVRVSQLQASYGLDGSMELRAVTYGDADDEARLHHYFRNLYAGAFLTAPSEWFFPGGALIYYTHLLGLPSQDDSIGWFA